MFSITSDYSPCELDSATVVPKLEDALNRSFMEEEEIIRLLFLAYLDASSHIELAQEQPAKPLRIRDMESRNPELLDKLKEWRRAKSQERNVPQYVVMTNSVLVGISDAVPFTNEGLMKIKGFGKTMLERYGEELLAITHEYFNDDLE